MGQIPDWKVAGHEDEIKQVPHERAERMAAKIHNPRPEEGTAVPVASV